MIPFFAFPPEVRRVIYTTNASESVHARIRKVIKTRGHFPTDDAATKLIWLALRNITATRLRRSAQVGRRHSRKIKSKRPHTQNSGHSPARA